MSTKLFRILVAASGIVGVVALGLYYSGVLVPAQLLASNTTGAQLDALAIRYHDAIFLDAWVQGTGALLTVVFYIGLVSLARAANGFAGLMAIIGSGVVLVVALMEGLFTFASSQKAIVGHMQTALVSADLSVGVFGYVFFIVPAPLIFLSLGSVILSSHVLPRILGYLALALGIAFEIGGFVGLFSAVAGAFDVVSTIIQIFQVLWTIAAAITLLISTLKLPNTASTQIQASTIV